MVDPIILNLLIVLKLLYIILVAIIFKLHSMHQDISRLSRVKKWIQIINELLMYIVIIYIFTPTHKEPVVVTHREKISLFIFALIGLSKINWNLILNQFGIHIHTLELLYNTH